MNRAEFGAKTINGGQEKIWLQRNEENELLKEVDRRK